ncbi:MAG: LacI family DNA-binding transcriptional regulator [Roseobacter sp.]
MSKTTSPTLEDVARLAGVSTASISRVLNEPGKVAEKTRQRIEEAIDTLGYTPNFGGRALASSRTNTVGAIVPSIANAMFSSSLQAFQEALAEEGVTLLVATTGFDPVQELQQIKSLIGQGADGLLLIGNERPETTWEFIDKRRVPNVVTWIDSARKGHLCVGFDNEKAAHDATRRAMDLGHRRIAVITGIIQGNDRARARFKGIVDAVSQYGNGARITRVVEVPYLLDEGGAALDQIMQQEETPTVVMCGNDALAAGAMVKARELGLSLPQDLSFVGFDDIGLARVVFPPLSTVRVPQVKLGRASAKLLLDVIAGKSDLHSMSFETEFIQRSSLVAPLEA